MNDLHFHNSRPRLWWLIARMKCCIAATERRENTRLRRLAMEKVRKQGTSN